MKHTHKIFYTMLCIFLLGSCNNFDDDININPNQPSEASAPQLLANAMLSLPGLSSSPQGEFMAQYLAETQYVTASLYPNSSTSFYGWYQGPLINIETVLNESESESHLMVAKILKAYYFWNITDRWGDVPFTEALEGGDNFTPVYDTQESIYDALFAMLKDANATTTTGSMPNDIMYGGSYAKWKKLANTIRLLMALRLSKVDPDLGQTEFNAALADGVFTSSGDNLAFKHLADANNQNYWYGQIVTQSREWWALTQGMVDIMKPVDDPRLYVYGNPNRTDGEYVGQLYGDTQDFDTEKYSLLGNAIWQQDAPVQLVTYAQVLFAKAEAAKLGWIAGGDTEAEANYNLAIETSIEQWTGSTAGASDLLLQPGVAYEAVNAIEQIATQRWIHLFMHGYEAWAEWRRTGFPDHLVEPGGAAVPRRLIYIESEQFNNTKNYEDAVQRQFSGEDGLYGRIWWDEE
ncbi:MAG: SusD/RagB family nutrient-binding outer membrane lipoprotein [Bacteroidia bacterium]|nr:SusD/RagB family nutrient-binding outer membrane lipoprotein [Bacteroidia bacterium]